MYNTVTKSKTAKRIIYLCYSCSRKLMCFVIFLRRYINISNDKFLNLHLSYKRNNSFSHFKTYPQTNRGLYIVPYPVMGSSQTFKRRNNTQMFQYLNFFAKLLKPRSMFLMIKWNYVFFLNNCFLLLFHFFQILLLFQHIWSVSIKLDDKYITLVLESRQLLYLLVFITVIIDWHLILWVQEI